MIRPELRKQLWHWRGVLIALGIGLGFTMLTLSSFGISQMVFAACGLAALIVAFSAFQRARFSLGQGAAGLVEADEGVISYLTAFGGGQIAVDELSSVVLLPETAQHVWRLETSDSMMKIPTTAHNVEALFDAFMRLQGFETEKMLRNLRALPDHPVVIWRKEMKALH